MDPCDIGYSKWWRWKNAVDLLRSGFNTITRSPGDGERDETPPELQQEQRKRMAVAELKGRQEGGVQRRRGPRRMYRDASTEALWRMVEGEEERE